MSNQKKELVKIIHWALGSVNYDYIHIGYKFCHCETYMYPDYFLPMFESGEYQRKHPNVDFAGAYVLDKKEIVEKDVSIVFRSPLLDLDLGRKSIKHFLSEVEKDGKLENAKSLDYVSLDLYLEYWTKLGAKFGKVQKDGRTIIWRNK